MTFSAIPHIFSPVNTERSIWATLTPPPPDHHDRTPVDAGRRNYVAHAARKAGCLGRGEVPAGLPGKVGSTRKKWN